MQYRTMLSRGPPDGSTASVLTDAAGQMRPVRFRLPAAPIRPEALECGVLLNVVVGGIYRLHSFSARLGPWSIPSQGSRGNVQGGADIERRVDLCRARLQCLRLFCI